MRTGERAGVSNSPNTAAIAFEFGPGGSDFIRGRSDPSFSCTCNPNLLRTIRLSRLRKKVSLCRVPTHKTIGPTITALSAARSS